MSEHVGHLLELGLPLRVEAVFLRHARALFAVALRENDHAFADDRDRLIEDVLLAVHALHVTGHLLHLLLGLFLYRLHADVNDLVIIRAEMSLTAHADQVSAAAVQAVVERARLVQIPALIRDAGRDLLGGAAALPERRGLTEDLAVLVGAHVPAAVGLVRDAEGLVVRVHRVEQHAREPLHVRGDRTVGAALVRDDQLGVLDADGHLLAQIAEKLRALHQRVVRLILPIRLGDDLRALRVQPHVVVLDRLKTLFDLGDPLGDGADHVNSSHKSSSLPKNHIYGYLLLLFRYFLFPAERVKCR